MSPVIFFTVYVPSPLSTISPPEMRGTFSKTRPSPGIIMNSPPFSIHCSPFSSVSPSADAPIKSSVTFLYSITVPPWFVPTEPLFSIIVPLLNSTPSSCFTRSIVVPSGFSPIIAADEAPPAQRKALRTRKEFAFLLCGCHILLLFPSRFQKCLNWFTHQFYHTMLFFSTPIQKNLKMDCPEKTEQS